MSLYAWIIIGTIAGPIALSFDKKVHFYKYFKFLFPALITVGLLFILWDEFFTRNQVWGFTPKYLMEIYIGNLPLEEVLFFLVVPYACVFIYEVLQAYFPKVNLIRFAHLFAFAFTFAGLFFAMMNLEKWYTVSACSLTALLTIWVYFINKKKWYGNFAFAYVVALIPFLIVNGILTGAITDEPVVWYSEMHIMGPRIYTIPVEDLFYNYAMLLPVIGIYEFLKTKWGNVLLNKN
jgi:lycopene cyclase domain-containing protein